MEKDLIHENPIKVALSKIKAFAYSFINSITSLSYYKEIIQTDFRFSLKYFIFMGILVSFFTALGLTIKMIPKIDEFTNELGTELYRFYPQDFEIYIEKTQWKINKEEPFSIPLPTNLENAARIQNENIPEGPKIRIPKNLIVFFHQGTINDLEKLDTLILINEKNILAQSSTKTEVYPLGELPNKTINKEEFQKFTENLKNISGFIAPFLVLIITTSLLLAHILFRSIILVAMSLLLTILSSVLKVKINLLQNFQIAIHTMTLPLLIDVAVSITEISIPIPYWFLIINLVFGIVVIAFIRKNEPNTKNN